MLDRKSLCADHLALIVVIAAEIQLGGIAQGEEGVRIALGVEIVKFEVVDQIA